MIFLYKRSSGLSISYHGAYSAESKGKIERFNRTLDTFLAEIAAVKPNVPRGRGCWHSLMWTLNTVNWHKKSTVFCGKIIPAIQCFVMYILC